MSELTLDVSPGGNYDDPDSVLMPQKQHTIHGRDHLPTGADPIPGLATSPSGGDYESGILAEPALVGYWPLNETSGDALDLSGNGYHFDDADFAGPPAQGRPGPFPDLPAETSYEFTSAYLERISPVVATDAISIELWLHPYLYPVGNPCRVIQILGLGLQLGVRIQGTFDSNVGEMAFEPSNTGQILTGTGNTVNLDEWTHFVGVSSDTEPMKIYWNGALIATGSANAANIGGWRPQPSDRNRNRQQLHRTSRPGRPLQRCSHSRTDHQSLPGRHHSLRQRRARQRAQHRRGRQPGVGAEHQHARRHRRSGTDRRRHVERRHRSHPHPDGPEHRDRLERRRTQPTTHSSGYPSRPSPAASPNWSGTPTTASSQPVSRRTHMTTRFADHLLDGTHASRPAATAVPAGTLYPAPTTR